MKLKVIKGDTIEEQIRSIDTVLRRLLKRSNSMTATAFISKCGLSTFTEVAFEGAAFAQAISPVSGTLEKVIIFIEDIPKVEGEKDGIAIVEVMADISTEVGASVAMKLRVGKSYDLSGNDIKLPEGTRLKCRTDRLLNKVWCCYVIKPQITPVVVDVIVEEEPV